MPAQDYVLNPGGPNLGDWRTFRRQSLAAVVGTGVSPWQRLLSLLSDQLWWEQAQPPSSTSGKSVVLPPFTAVVTEPPCHRVSPPSSFCWIVCTAWDNSAGSSVIKQTRSAIRMRPRKDYSHEEKVRSPIPSTNHLSDQECCVWLVFSDLKTEFLGTLFPLSSWSDVLFHCLYLYLLDPSSIS